MAAQRADCGLPKKSRYARVSHFGGGEPGGATIAPVAYDFTGLKPSGAIGAGEIAGLFNADVTLDRGWDLYARIGYLVQPDTLLDALAGYALQDVDLSTVAGFGLEWDADGYTVGGGLEAAVADHLSWKLEYRYAGYDLGDFGLSGLLDVEVSTHTVRTGLSRKLC